MFIISTLKLVIARVVRISKGVPKTCKLEKQLKRISEMKAIIIPKV
jgi:hypothetical protein